MKHIQTFENFVDEGSVNERAHANITATKWTKYQRKEYKPERVASWEIGYKGLLGKKVLVDAYYYQSTFTNFDVSQVVLRPNANGTNNVYSFPTNADSDVKTEGWALGIDYSLPKEFSRSNLKILR
jgi:outer membrane receptor protein involved in Fe transport